MQISAIFFVTLLLLLTACSGGGGSGGNGGNSIPTNYQVGGTVSGVIPAAGSGSQLVLENNGGDPLFLNKNGAFAFSQVLPAGAAYDVTIHIGPVAPPETCTVQNAGGQAGPASATAVTITCALKSFTVGGTVSGLGGSSLTLSDMSNNGAQSLTISANGPFTFATPIPYGDSYNVSVVSQPVNPNETCFLSNQDGDVRSNITNVTVSCEPNLYTIGGNVTGLTGSGLVLAINGGGNLPVSASAAFTFPPGLLASGSPYILSVAKQPSNPLQTCIVPNGVGTIANASVTTLNVICSIPRFAYGAGGHGNDVLAYAIDVTGGALTMIAGSPFPAGDSTYGITVDPGNRFLYATNIGATFGPGSNTISAYTIDSATGALTAVTGSPFASVVAPTDIAVEPTGRFVYTADLHDNTVSAYAISGTGALTAITGSAFVPGIDGPRKLTIHPTGKFLYLSVSNESTIWAYAIDANTGALTLVSGSPFMSYGGYPPAILRGPTALAITPDGQTTYFANTAEAESYVSTSTGTINTSNGALTTLVNWLLPLFNLTNSVVLEPQGSFAYITGRQSRSVNFSVQSICISLACEADAGFQSVTPPAQTASTIADPSGRFLYVVDVNGNAYAYTIDRVTGDLTAAATTSSAFAPGQQIVITKQ